MALRFVGHTISPSSRLKMAAQVNDIWDKEPELSITKMVKRTGASVPVVKAIRSRRVAAGKMMPVVVFRGTDELDEG